MDASLSRLTTEGSWDELLQAARAGLEAALPRYLVGRRWFGRKARHIQRVELLDAAPVRPGAGPRAWSSLRVSYEDSAPEVYSLPLTFAPGAWAAGSRRLPRRGGGGWSRRRARRSCMPPIAIRRSRGRSSTPSPTAGR